MYAVYKKMKPHIIGPVGGYLCLFDSLYWFESNAKKRVEEINATPSDYAYYKEQKFADPTVGEQLVPHELLDNTATHAASP